MRGYVVPSIVIFCGLLVVSGAGCGGNAASSPAPSSSDRVLSVGLTAQTTSALPTCTKALVGTIAVVSTPPGLWECIAQHWLPILCTSLNAGAVAYESTTKSLWACVRGVWTAVELAPGPAGPKGEPGAEALVKVSPEDAGEHCANGGTKVDAGIDTNGNGVLDPSEVTSTNYVCNGANGTNGADGANGATGSDGANGLTTLVKLSTEPADGNCPNGGTKIEAGIDTNSDGVLDTLTEVTSTNYVCNGTPGSATIPPSDLTYSTNPAVYTIGEAIAPNVPSSSDGPVAVYLVKPDLPAGLNLDNFTGIISGTPTDLAATAIYTITASNSGGSTIASLSITVNPPSPVIIVGPESQPEVVGMPGYFGVLASGTGPLSYQWLRDGILISDATSVSYMTPPVVQTDDGDTFSVVVSDTYGGSVTSQPATMLVSSGFAFIGGMTEARENHTATLLPSGKVLIAGGYNQTSGSLTFLASADLYDPVAGTFTNTGSMATARDDHTATLLPSGKVLITGGYGPSGRLASAELYDPATGMFTATGSMTTARYFHTATLLPSGKVLIAGGQGTSGYTLSSVELYDPDTGTFTPTGSLTIERSYHTATLLPSGKVLIAGGYNQTSGSPTFLASADLYDPVAGTFSATGSMQMARLNHTTTLLSSGKVLIAGGYNATSHWLASAELYDPVAETFTATGNLTVARTNHTATLLPSGKVLIAGGYNQTSGYVMSAELYDSVTGMFTAAGNLTVTRINHTATLLPSGKVLIAGGLNGQISLAFTELYDPLAGTFTATGSLATARYGHTATLLPSGKVLIAGGSGSSYQGYLDSAELYDPAPGTFTATGSLATARCGHTATLLPSGKVLIAGGRDQNCSPLTSAELYDPTTGMFTATGSLGIARSDHTATFLANGKVLIAAGSGSSYPEHLDSAELYDPALGTFTATGSLVEARYYHTATLLPNGKVLIAGGFSYNWFTDFLILASAELYDPATGMFTATGSLATERNTHTATLLPSGKVLIAGGQGNSGFLASAELYDPDTRTFTVTGSLAVARYRTPTTLLSSGKVLIAGGELWYGNYLASAELYDPATGTFTATGSLATARGVHTATLLLSGKALIAGGGYGTSGYLASAELFRWW